jgi:hypothetical protein
MVPVIPVALGLLRALPFVESTPVSAVFEIGQASKRVAGSRVPARLFDNGWLNMS